MKIYLETIFLSITFVIILNLVGLRSCRDYLSPTKLNNIEIPELMQIDTSELNGEDIILIRVNGNPKGVVTLTGDTIVPYQDYYSQIKFLDINLDGFLDIRLFVLSNTPNQCDNYLYDTIGRSFELIKNCDLDISKIPSSQFYYSYHRAGCSDDNWVSDLSKVNDYELENYGRIYGNGCESDDSNDIRKILIYSVDRNDKHNSIPMFGLKYSDFINDSVSKWDFIHSYWSEHFEKFDRQ